MARHTDDSGSHRVVFVLSFSCDHFYGASSTGVAVVEQIIPCSNRGKTGVLKKKKKNGNRNRTSSNSNTLL